MAKGPYKKLTHFSSFSTKFLHILHQISSPSHYGHCLVRESAFNIANIAALRHSSNLTEKWIWLYGSSVWTIWLWRKSKHWTSDPCIKRRHGWTQFQTTFAQSHIYREKHCYTNTGILVPVQISSFASFILQDNIISDHFQVVWAGRVLYHRVVNIWN